MYSQINAEQRVIIATLQKAGYSKPRIAEEISVHRSAIYRELKRNSSQGAYGVYNARQAQQRSTDRASNKGRMQVIDSFMEDHIREAIMHDEWSPEQIKGRAKKDGISMASHETIYQFVYEDKRAGGTLYTKLRRSHRCRRKRKNTNKRRGMIIGRVGIEKRPPVVDRQDRFGDWEGDTIVGKGHKSAMATMVERKSLYTVLIPLDHQGADHTAERIIAAMEGHLCRTSTFDNGKEFACHLKIAEALNLKVFFASPYSAWQRGCNENTNGLIRQYLPKSTPLGNKSKEEVKAIEDKLNNRPRKKLGYKTPNEVYLRYCRT
jgi:transposase, IS30 family